MKNIITHSLHLLSGVAYNEEDQVDVASVDMEKEAVATVSAAAAMTWQPPPGCVKS